MIIIWGQRNYGKVDKVGNFCYVATQFGHLWFIPLIPIQSWIVVAGSESDNGFRGVPIGNSAKSILTAWMRAAAIIGTPIMLIVAFVSTMEALQPRGNPITAFIHWLVLSALIGALVLSYWRSYASLDRAMELADHLGVSRVLMAKMVHPERTEEELAMQVDEMPATEGRKGDRGYDQREGERYDYRGR